MSANLTTDEKAALLKSANFTVENPETDIFDKLNNTKDISVWESPVPFKNVDLPKVSS